MTAAASPPGPFASWWQAASKSRAAQAGPTRILIRTHYVDDVVDALADQLRRDTGWPVCLVVDETKGKLPGMAGREYLGLTQEVFAGLQLYSTPDIGWRCGDYALYAARQAFPEASHFWMVEPDVRIGLGDVGPFFRHFEERPDYDLLATYYGRAGAEYMWTAMIAPFCAEPRKCMFPIVRFSAAALDYLLLQRRVLSSAFREERYWDGRLRSLEIWPNDEVFTASMLHQGGFVASDINGLGGSFYNDQTFSYAFPISLARFGSRPLDGQIYHPVLQGEAFLRKVRSMFEHVRLNRGPASLMRGLFARRDLYDDIRAECGGEESERFEADVQVAPSDDLSRSRPMPIAW